ncbi:hypothetical protein KBZ94_23635 [Streptomyces sp. RM72]|uniref:hypothetical protein n=1 Tax=unclassified Streptomyces TaxID=2593676 RepID=UPI000978F6A7|nr:MULTISPECIES: hypothetical protein [unclassified Streptomyces]MBQ0887878.1 hypothetical protein [Streptomyces sp. RM72]OMI84727.1 hypothetical protein BSZ07_36255 [Streptomyces sp. M1013]
MDEHDNALHAAFQEYLGARPEPALPSVVDAAVTGGRRIRRRRMVLAAASTLVGVACVATVATTLSGADAKPGPQPVAPAATPSATPSPSTAAPKDSESPGTARTAESTPSGGADRHDPSSEAERASTGAQRSDDR